MWNDFFLYTKGERRGIMVLLILIVTLLLLRFTMPYWESYFIAQVSNKEFEKRIFELNDSLNSKMNIHYSDSLFYFDPNIVTDSELVKLGFSNYQRKSFIGYRKKIGNFESKEDLIKVYGVDSILISKLEPYIQFSKPKEISARNIKKIVWVNFNYVDDQFWMKHISSDKIRDSIKKILDYGYVQKSLPLRRVLEYSDSKLLLWLKDNLKYNNPNRSKPFDIVPIELNAADTLALMHVHGIGSKLAKRIVKFRDLLGGFYKKEQMKEVYGLSEEWYNKIERYVYVNEKLVHKINPSKDGFNRMKKHPYFSINQSKELFNLYRKTQKPTVSDVGMLESINEVDLEKMKMYLVVF